MNVKQFLNAKHEDIPVRQARACCETMMEELGYKCAGTSYYLKDGLTGMQNAVRKVVTVNNLEETEQVTIKGAFLYVGKVVAKELEYNYLVEIFNAIKRKC